MTYFRFLVQWYNLPFVAALVIAILSLARPTVLERVGQVLAGWLGISRLSGRAVVRTCALAVTLIGLTLNGALHDHWPAAQQRGFIPVLLITLGLAALVTRGLGRFLERHFPEIKAISWGGPGQEGREGRIVSRVVSPDYAAGRAQVMGEDQTLHMVLCKTRADTIPYGSLVVLEDYDAGDGRYFVRRAGADASERINTGQEPSSE